MSSFEAFSVPWWVVAISVLLLCLALGAMLLYLTRNRHWVLSAMLMAVVAGAGVITGVVSARQGESVSYEAWTQELERLDQRSGGDGLRALDEQEQVLSVLTEEALLADTRRGRAEEFLQVMGAELSTDMDASTCQAPITHHTDDVVIAAFCPEEPSVIHVDHSIIILNHDIDLLEVLRHELAHRSIQLRCGPTPVDGGKRTIDEGRVEQVAVAYSDLYLGGNSASMRGRVSSEYIPHESDLRAAHQVRAGSCG